MVKRWLWLLLAASFAVPAFSQTIDGRQDPELSEAYTEFFYKVHRLMVRDDWQRNECVSRYSSSYPGCHVVQPDHKNADNWLIERRFSPNDISRIESETVHWHIGSGAVGSTQEEREQKLAKNSLSMGVRLESELVDGKYFHKMIQQCARQLRLAPETGGCSFAPVKPRAT